MPEESEEIEENQDEEEELEPETTETDLPLTSFFSPEGIIMMIVAFFIDLAGFIVLIFGFDDYGILDVIGLFIIGGWMLFRSGTIVTTKKARKIGVRFLKRLGLSFLGESIPYVGSIAPCWILAVYFELKNK